MKSAVIHLGRRVIVVEGWDREGLTWGFREALRSAVPWEVHLDDGGFVTINPFAVQTIEDKPS